MIVFFITRFGMETLESLLQDLESRENDLLGCCNRIDSFSAHIDRVDETSRTAISGHHNELDGFQVAEPAAA
jgi:hypothetical protein